MGDSVIDNDVQSSHAIYTIKLGKVIAITRDSKLTTDQYK